MATPYQNQDNSKKDQVAEMFDNISTNYDFLNHFFSLGIDKLWRRRVKKIAKQQSPKQILDVATGTADLAIALSSLPGSKITGVDISRKMLAVGDVKVKKKGLQEQINLEYGDSEDLPFSDSQFDLVTISFGIRNFENMDKGMREISRVLASNGRLIILEFSNPRIFPIKQIFNLYFNKIMPFVGRLISKDKRAYSYLPESVKVFPTETEFVEQLKANGFKTAEYKNLSFGIASIYIAQK